MWYYYLYGCSPTPASSQLRTNDLQTNIISSESSCINVTSDLCFQPPAKINGNIATGTITVDAIESIESCIAVNSDLCVNNSNVLYGSVNGLITTGQIDGQTTFPGITVGATIFMEPNRPIFGDLNGSVNGPISGTITTSQINGSTTFPGITVGATIFMEPNRPIFGDLNGSVNGPISGTITTSQINGSTTFPGITVGATIFMEPNRPIFGDLNGSVNGPVNGQITTAQINGSTTFAGITVGATIFMEPNRPIFGDLNGSVNGPVNGQITTSQINGSTTFAGITIGATIFMEPNIPIFGNLNGSVNGPVNGQITTAQINGSTTFPGITVGATIFMEPNRPIFGDLNGSVNGPVNGQITTSQINGSTTFAGITVGATIFMGPNRPIFGDLNGSVNGPISGQITTSQINGSTTFAGITVGATIFMEPNIPIFGNLNGPVNGQITTTQINGETGVVGITVGATIYMSSGYPIHSALIGSYILTDIIATIPSSNVLRVNAPIQMGITSNSIISNATYISINGEPIGSDLWDYVPWRTMTFIGDNITGFYGGVLGKDGLIYCIPKVVPNNIHVIDTKTNAIYPIGPTITNSYDNGAVIAKNGKIYAKSNAAGTLLKYDTNGNTYTEVSLPENLSTLTLAPNGLIYGGPNNFGETIVYIDTNNNDAIGGIDTGAALSLKTSVIVNDRIYFIPFNNNIFLSYNYVEDMGHVDTITIFPHAYGSVSANGKIYSIPNINDGMLIFDAATGATSYININGGVGSGWVGGVLGPDNIIYCAPGPNIATINTITDTAAQIPVVPALASPTDSFGGGVLAPNGCIYFIPDLATKVLVYNTFKGNAFNSSILSAYYNKL